MSNTDPSPEFLAEDSGGQLTATAITFMVLLVSFAGLRLVSQRQKRRPFALDDLFSYIGLFFILSECIIALVMVPVAGVGRHVAYLEIAAPEKLHHEYIIMFPIEICYISAFTFPKLAILWMYLKIFTLKTPRNITFVLIAVLIATWIAETLSAIFQCWPVAYIWDKSIQDGHCVNQNALFQFWSVPNIVTDTIMLVLPMPTVWSLQMSLPQKVGLTCTILLGSIGMIASIVRFAIFTKTAALQDATWASVPLQIWTIVEPSMYFFAGILPTLRPVFSPFFSGIRTRVKTTKDNYFSSGSGAIQSTRDRNRRLGSERSGPASRQVPGDGNPNGDSVALVDYSGTVVGGKGNESDGESGHGITRTQEVTITRDGV